MKLTSITLSIVGIFIALACANGLLQLSGKARGDFVIIGSFCVPRKVTGVEKLAEGKSSDSKSNPTLTVHVTSGDSSLKNQKLLLYTDGMANLQSVSKGGQKCEERAELSQKICVDGGATCYNDGYPLGTGTTEMSIEITQARNRQWFVAVANCDSTTDKNAPVNLAKYQVDVNAVEDCATMRKADSVVGYVVVLASCAILICFFAGLTFKFYKDSEDINVLRARYGGYDDVTDSGGL